ncbi:MFS transporter [Herminiimonas sp. CN]|uniref:MFS transporter n=1 Tax=Herminiimonas sp. CN TaxID=1349818 RepID=UPI0004732DD2|nr:MFS transporter [Herminiimonas sp. CN]
MRGLPWRDFLALTVSVAVVGLGLGATLPLTALTLDQRGLGNHVVGLMTALGAIGILAVVPFVARWVARFGPRNSMIGAVAVAALATMLMQTGANLIYWGLLRFIFGAALGVLFTVGEAWINRLAPDGSRGRVVALYATTFTLFQLIGPALVALLAGRIDWPFAACGALFLLSIPGLALMPNHSHIVDNEHAADWKIVAPRMPVIILGAAFFALFDALALSLLPLFGMRHGIPVEQALLSASVMLIGDTTLQFPLGWLADRVGRARVHMGCGLLACLLLPLMPFAVSVPWLWWTLLYVLGGAAGGIYVLSLVACGERFSGQRLVAASAIVNATWGVSSSGGPLLTGVLMQSINVNALVLVLWLGAATFVASLLWEQRPAFIAKILARP